MFVHDISYDSFGTRLLVCCSNRIIVYIRDSILYDTTRHNNSSPPSSSSSPVFPVGYVGESGWTVEAVIHRPHDGPVWRGRWASAEFGQMFATCSEDRCVAIWTIADSDDKVCWVKRCKLRDFKRCVTDIRFSPTQYGLFLAACSDDGYVRIYQLQDASEFRSWTLTDQLALLLPGPSVGRPVSDRVGFVGCVALDWCDGNDDVMALAVLGQNGVLYIWARCVNASKPKWQLLQMADAHQQSKDVSCSPRFSRSFDLICTAGCGPSLMLWSWEFSADDAKALYAHKPTVASSFSSTSSLTSGDTSPTTPLLKPHFWQPRSLSSQPPTIDDTPTATTTTATDSSSAKTGFQEQQQQQPQEQQQQQEQQQPHEQQTCSIVNILDQPPPRQAVGLSLYVSNPNSRKFLSYRLMGGRLSRPSVKWSNNVGWKDTSRKTKQPIFAQSLGYGRLLPLQVVDALPCPVSYFVR
eukprot:GHVS01016335.1.p2 GENE.GHVS01016335.1~~GHVS01016335.1.p2  ORF type:complete len:466 (+),score=65.84 GHVS01016335.1:88-1485(+)